MSTSEPMYPAAPVSRIAPIPPIPFNERERISALRASCILDTPADPAFDEITAFAALSLHAPIATVSLIDQHRQWFKSKVGVEASETAREDAFCAYAILQRAPLVVLDATQDIRFRDNPVVTAENGIRFYVGVPVRSEDGMPLGTLCVADTVVRSSISPVSIAILQELAGHIEHLIRAYRAAGYLDRATGFNNQRRFRENVASLCIADRDLAGTEQAVGAQRWWAIGAEAVSAEQARTWAAAGNAVLIDARVKRVGRWMGAATAPRDGVYRLSARHVGFIVEASGEEAMRSLARTLVAGLTAPVEEAGNESTERHADARVRFAKLSAEADADSVLAALSLTSAPLERVERVARVEPRSTRALVMPIADRPKASSSSSSSTSNSQSNAQTNSSLSSPSSNLARASASAPDEAHWHWQPRFALLSDACVGFDIGWCDARNSAYATYATCARDELSVEGFETAMALFSRWCVQNNNHLARVTIGGSLGLFFRDDLIPWLVRAQTMGVALTQIDIPLPVAALRASQAASQTRMRLLREMGVGVMVTGFGAGFDMLGWLPNLPFSAVQFDPLVVDAVCRDTKHATVVRRLASLVHSLGARVIAHRIETPEALAAARLLGCDEGSGEAFAGLGNGAMPAGMIGQAECHAAGAGLHIDTGRTTRELRHKQVDRPSPTTLGALASLAPGAEHHFSNLQAVSKDSAPAGLSFIPPRFPFKP